MGCSPWGHKESDMSEWLPFHFHCGLKAQEAQGHNACHVPLPVCSCGQDSVLRW